MAATMSHWPDKDDIKALSEMRYGDGSKIQRGDVVHIPSEPGTRLYRVIGLNPERDEVYIMPTTGKSREVSSSLVSRW